MFSIQSSNGAVLNHQMKKEISGLDARKTLETNMRVSHKQATDPWFKSRVDQADAMKNYKMYKNNHERTCPETLKPEVQNQMWKRAKQLKDEFIVGMLSQDELQPIKGVQVEGIIKNVVDWERINTNRSVERNTKWYAANDKKIIEFKNIMRHLCPDNPAASDIEKFRPRRKTV